ncbi:fasciclin-like arabinogalactan protein 21 [Cornus florida]|uniref:fasciclin-like arabinogalactan protein 21 n=1 Tax=Cornus florida TaxID=4283 RepID=UPI00289E14AA|nr:fasciclin-like arabinogalactan protein 21 [Cornus florida]
MATTLQLLILTSILISTRIVLATEEACSPASSPSSAFQEHAFLSSLFGPVLTNLGFQELASAASSLSTSTTWRGPATIFAPTDSSLLTCPSCSVPLLLQEHTIPGLYPVHFLSKLAFGTKLETLAPGRCLTIMSDKNSSKIFVGGVEVTRPDLFNNGLVVVHGIQGFISHLLPFSCHVERMTSLSFPPPPPVEAFFMMRLMLKDAMLRLQVGGYSVLALALRVKYAELLDLRTMTVFALDDASIFAGGHEYISDLRFHIVPNRMLKASDLLSLPAATELPTLELGQKLVVTTASGGGPLAPMRINYVKIKRFDFMHNLKIVVHGLPLPFPHIRPTDSTGYDHIERSAWNVKESGFNAGIQGMMTPTQSDESTVENDHHGL